jgi:metal-responsive CopG/Arc/MetJ family transcriptional regulator
MTTVKGKVITKKRGPGRPRKDDPIRTVVSVALSAANAERLAEWMAENGIESRSEAGRLLIEQGLEAAAKRAARREGAR